MKQFDDVPGTYGAPMGRAEYGTVENCEDWSIELFRVRLLGDYDEGGAYWGGGRGTIPLYCARARDGEYRRFARAWSRKQAAEELEIPNIKLIRGIREHAK